MIKFTIDEESAIRKVLQNHIPVLEQLAQNNRQIANFTNTKVFEDKIQFLQTLITRIGEDLTETEINQIKTRFTNVLSFLNNRKYKQNVKYTNINEKIALCEELLLRINRYEFEILNT